MKYYVQIELTSQCGTLTYSKWEEIDKELYNCLGKMIDQPWKIQDHKDRDKIIITFKNKKSFKH